MQRQTKEKHFVKKPIYPGGLAAMRSFIKNELKYPEDALKNKIEGKVMVKYEVSHQGKVTSTKVMNSIGYGCDEEAKRVVKKLKFKIPKIPYRTKVTFKKTIKISFKLPKEKPVVKKKIVPAQQIRYTVTSKKKSDHVEIEEKSSYSYTINL